MLSIQEKLIVALGAVIVLLMAGFGIHRHGVTQGKTLERAVWLNVDALRKDAQLKLVLAHDADMAAERAKNFSNNLKVSEDHEASLTKLRADRAADRSDADRRGGLRIPAPSARCDRPVAGPEATGDSRRDEAPPATVRLPPAIENDLWAITDDADEVVEQARACQAWIRKHGFYGPATVDEPVLPGRIVSAPTQMPEVEK